jgi:DNA repair photolyase
MISTSHHAINRHYRDVKRALRKGLLVNGFNLGKYGFSPYAACSHACTYCDGRAEKYFVEGDFGTDIVIRRNLPEVLDAEFAKLREPGIVSIGSGISDPYQPVEADEHIMERCARLIAKHGYAATLLTKSALILRDIDIWKEVHAKRGFILMLSLVFTNDAERRLFEPAAGSAEERLEVVRQFRAAGIPVCILAMPLLPYIADTDEKAGMLFNTLARLGVNSIVPGGLTLRPGRQKELYLDVIREHYPHLHAPYEKLYDENRPSGACMAAYSKDCTRRMAGLLAPLNIPLGLAGN